MKQLTKRSFGIALTLGITIGVQMFSSAAQAKEIVSVEANCDTATLAVDQYKNDGEVSVAVFVDGVEQPDLGTVWEAVQQYTPRTLTVSVGPGHEVYFVTDGQGYNSPHETSDVVTTTDCTDVQIAVSAEVSCESEGSLVATNNGTIEATIKVVKTISDTDPSEELMPVPAGGQVEIPLGVPSGTTMQVVVQEGNEELFNQSFTRQTVAECNPTTTSTTTTTTTTTVAPTTTITTVPPTTTAPPTTEATTTTTTTQPPAPTTTQPTTTTTQPSLPVTGGNGATMSIVALGLLAAGTALVVASRRPQEA